MLPTKTTLRAVLCCSAAVFAVSCVNEDYDLSKEIDKKINISGDFSAPLGDSELIQIGEFLNLDKDDQDVLKTDANGDYYVQVIGNGSATGFYVPSVAIDDALVTDGGFRASVDRNDIVNKFNHLGNSKIFFIKYAHSFVCFLFYNLSIFINICKS